ncbi:hypothetical protein A1O1_00393 [Capronia coronata CBS 617.96]|uniref:Uncharacterized protein n=1 Tax=Capronia coronata CBS 617.96 TaxID=1182541 RepID=W9YRS3_9EURO|nr:uncharacterized protein A1O1_00393 [Capronia coronata CBS 617.96]EXJ95273.1 hypothetical protein A1O1_00393 [Capronia coronata CBS 617.96]
MSRRESVARLRVISQSDATPPLVKMVSCAVLPPRFLHDIVAPQGVDMYDAFTCRESIGWEHNGPVRDPEHSRRKSFLRKVGLTSRRERDAAADDLPPFVLRQIPYDVWRKHYAKDKDGNYRGTHAPAEDCLLKPEDVQKWRLDDPVTKADTWTRGREALPVYADVCAEGPVPEYRLDHEGRIGSHSTESLTQGQPSTDPVP